MCVTSVYANLPQTHTKPTLIQLSCQSTSPNTSLFQREALWMLVAVAVFAVNNWLQLILDPSCFHRNTIPTKKRCILSNGGFKLQHGQTLLCSWTLLTAAFTFFDYSDHIYTLVIQIGVIQIGDNKHFWATASRVASVHLGMYSTSLSTLLEGRTPF